MDTINDRHDADILFSRTVKAGRRVYYVDVKQDRRGGFYVSVTESKRVRDGQEGQPPVFEKHKIFLYREDLEKFIEAFTAAADFAKSQPTTVRAANEQVEEPNNAADAGEAAVDETTEKGFSWDF